MLYLQAHSLVATADSCGRRGSPLAYVPSATHEWWCIYKSVLNQLHAYIGSVNAHSSRPVVSHSSSDAAVTCPRSDGRLRSMHVYVSVGMFFSRQRVP